MKDHLNMTKWSNSFLNCIITEEVTGRQCNKPAIKCESPEWKHPRTLYFLQSQQSLSYCPSETFLTVCHIRQWCRPSLRLLVSAALEDLTEAIMKSSAFWDTTRCRLLKVNWRFGRDMLPPSSWSKNRTSKKPAWKQVAGRALLCYSDLQHVYINHLYIRVTSIQSIPCI
jgi:hypothetical protein